MFFAASIVACLAIFVYDYWGRGSPDEDWQMMAMHLHSYFLVFLVMVIGISFILRPSNPKLADTFNQYNDLSNEDNMEGQERNRYPETASFHGTEMQDFNPVDPKEAARQERLRKENEQWKKNKPKPWEY